MSQKPNLVVAYHKDIAEQYIDAFGLDNAQWDAAAVYENRTGHRFDRVILVRPHWSMSAVDAIEFEFAIDDWRTLTGPNDYFKVL